MVLKSTEQTEDKEYEGRSELYFIDNRVYDQSNVKSSDDFNFELEFPRNFEDIE